MNIGKLLFSHKGRINRRQWWFGQLIGILVALAIGGLFHVSIPHEFSLAMFSIHNLSVGMVLGIFLFTCHFSMNMKRWHDLNRKGWYTGLCYLPVVGIFISIIVLGCLRGQKGSNKYGHGDDLDF